MPTSQDGSIFSWLSRKRDPQPLIVSVFQTSLSTRFSTRATQLELFAHPLWILSDPASVNRPGMDHRIIGEPVGGGGPHYEPSVRPVAVQHYRVAEQGVGGALVEQRALCVHVVGAACRNPQAQQQHHRLRDGGPSGTGPAPLFPSHALSEGNIQLQTTLSRSCAG